MTAISSDNPSIDLAPDDSTLTEAGILVVDEDPAFQLGLKTFLKEYVGFEKVFTARNGKEAIDLVAEEESIELLTVDFQMPGMDGIELLEHLREHSPRPLGITMITGFPSDRLKKEFASLNSPKILCNNLLAKPVEFEKLEPLILDSYEELKRSQMLAEARAAEEEEMEPEESIANLNAMAIAASNRELMAKFDLIEEKLEQNTRAMQNIGKSNFFGSLISDVLKLLIAGAIGWLAWQSGFLTKISDRLNPKAPLPAIEERAEPKIEPKAEPTISSPPVVITAPGPLRQLEPLDKVNDESILSPPEQEPIPRVGPVKPLPPLPIDPESASIDNFPEPE